MNGIIVVDALCRSRSRQDPGGNTLGYYAPQRAHTEALETGGIYLGITQVAGTSHAQKKNDPAEAGPSRVTPAASRWKRTPTVMGPQIRCGAVRANPTEGCHRLPALKPCPAEYLAAGGPNATQNVIAPARKINSTKTADVGYASER